MRLQPKPQRIRLINAILQLPHGDVKKLSGSNDYYRLRVGSYRIVFTIEDDILLITVVNANNRGQIYKEI